MYETLAIWTQKLPWHSLHVAGCSISRICCLFPNALMNPWGGWWSIWKVGPPRSNFNVWHSNLEQSGLGPVLSELLVSLNKYGPCPSTQIVSKGKGKPHKLKQNLSKGRSRGWTGSAIARNACRERKDNSKVCFNRLQGSSQRVTQPQMLTWAMAWPSVKVSSFPTPNVIMVSIAVWFCSLMWINLFPSPSCLPSPIFSKNR